ncbi:hypothetical protein GBAR_LOCUS28173 [Geodia barretti]|uniref:Uncharacterized protein n=1 Tax=Geodia barretti TaxID=519541 RepID=A0AA35XAE8_GEOBA|nr:hypothetical protein GBAR_LOCUS28173 [Geodia barretti]
MKCIEEDGGYRCVCPEGENCSTPGPSTAAPRQQSGETSSSMPPAVIGAIVAGLLVALLLCAVVVIAVVVCILMRKRRWSKCKCRYIPMLYICITFQLNPRKFMTAAISLSLAIYPQFYWSKQASDFPNFS